MAHSEPTKALSKQSPETAMLSAPFGCIHPPPPTLPFLLKVIAGSDVDESFIPDISGYIRERVNFLNETPNSGKAWVQGKGK